MKRIAILAGSLLACLPLASKNTPKRPRITGIDHVRIYVSNLDKATQFYAQTLGFLEGSACRNTPRSCVTVDWARKQAIEFQKVPSGSTRNWLAEVAFATDDVDQMHSYLSARGIAVGPLSTDASLRHFELTDPEGNHIAFAQRVPPFSTDDPPSLHQVGEQLLHAGFVVKDLAAENHFYRDVLGFRLYWRGGFKDQDTDWYEIQVPDGDNWIEYMLNIPANADHKELGVQNHFSLAVRDIHAAATQLRAHGLTNFDGPEIGRDGKWALDAYDPDETRVEFMEFAPAQKPCCAEYTGPHPKP
jgi:catechol 2,3-dioxygenase-like lactoylglutathione lyase family enzyme